MSTAEILQAPHKMSSAQLRKIKKPIIEKRRRERINESLNQLKTLVLEALDKDENQYNKMEKADILEMTVKHLRCLQQQVSDAQQTPHSTHAQTTRYKSGFNECADEVRRYLGTTNNITRGVKHELAAHLNTRVGGSYRDSVQDGGSPPSPASSPVSAHSSCSRDSFSTASSTSPVLDSPIQSNLCSNSNVVFPVNNSQTMLITEQVLAANRFMPIVISPMTSQQSFMTSHSMTSQPGSPLAGTVIPLYHTLPNHPGKDFRLNDASSNQNRCHIDNVKSNSDRCHMDSVQSNSNRCHIDSVKSNRCHIDSVQSNQNRCHIDSVQSNQNRCHIDSVKSNLQFTDKIYSVREQSLDNKYTSSFSVPQNVNDSTDPVWRPW